MKNRLCKAIKAYKRWACWRCDGLNRDGTFHRNFYIPVVGERIPAMIESFERLGDFKQAVKAVRGDMHFDGIAFLLGGPLPYVCITVADCIEPSTRKLNETATAILDKIHSSSGGYCIRHINEKYKSCIEQIGSTYIELSHDGASISIWGLGELPAGKKSIVPGVTIHQSGYIPITGRTVDNSQLQDLQAVIDSLAGCTEDKQAEPAEPSTRENEAESERKAGEIS